jgi:hypothetical protein
MSRWAMTRWCAARAWRHAVTAGLYVAETAAHALGLPKALTHRLGSEASMSAFRCSLDFEPVEIRRQVGWQCAHASVTSIPGAVPAVPRLWCGCHMQPVFA